MAYLRVIKFLTVSDSRLSIFSFNHFLNITQPTIFFLIPLSGKFKRLSH